jgi:hypothetical protein
VSLHSAQLAADRRSFGVYFFRFIRLITQSEGAAVGANAATAQRLAKKILDLVAVSSLS